MPSTNWTTPGAVYEYTGSNAPWDGTGNLIIIDASTNLVDMTGAQYSNLVEYSAIPAPSPAIPTGATVTFVECIFAAVSNVTDEAFGMNWQLSSSASPFPTVSLGTSAYIPTGSVQEVSSGLVTAPSGFTPSHIASYSASNFTLSLQMQSEGTVRVTLDGIKYRWHYALPATNGGRLPMMGVGQM